MDAFDQFWSESGVTQGDVWLPGAAERLNPDGTGAAIVGQPMGSLVGRHEFARLHQPDAALRPALQEINGKPVWEFDGDFLLADSPSALWSFLHKDDYPEAFSLIGFRIAPESASGAFYGLLATNPNTSSQPGLLLSWDNRTEFITNGYRILRGPFAGHQTNNEILSDSGIALPGVDVILAVLRREAAIEGWQQFNENIKALSGRVFFQETDSQSDPAGPLHVGAYPDGSESTRLRGHVFGAVCADRIPNNAHLNGMIADLALRAPAFPKTLLSGSFVTAQPAQNKRVFIRQWAQGTLPYKHLAAISTLPNGTWVYPVPIGSTYDLSYFAEGCSPVVHGPYYHEAD